MADPTEYTSVAEVRAEGVPAAITDQEIQTAIARATAIIDRVTRQFFIPKTLTLDLDGTDCDTLWLPVPVIEVTALYLNSNFTTALPTDRYRVYNGRGPVADDRKNPKLKITSRGSIFEPWTPYGPPFARGAKNQRVVGKFGYTDDDGMGGSIVPPLIKQAAILLAISDLKSEQGGAWYAEASSPSGSVASETTDGHSISYASLVSQRVGTSALTGNAKADQILMMYRGPTIVQAPGNIRG